MLLLGELNLGENEKYFYVLRSPIINITMNLLSEKSTTKTMSARSKQVDGLRGLGHISRVCASRFTSVGLRIIPCANSDDA